MEVLTVGQSQFGQCVGASKNVNNFFFSLRRANKLADTKYTGFISDVFNLLFVVRTDCFGNLVLIFLLYIIFVLTFAKRFEQV